MRTPCRLVCFAWALVVCAWLPCVTRADEPFVDPYTAASASGAWTVKVEPSESGGAGKARYTAAKGGVEVWAKSLDVTLREAVVADDGTLFGYAYDNGYTGWDGNLVVVVVDPAGKVLCQDAHPRDGPHAGIDPPPPGEPRAQGLLLDQSGGRAIVRVSRSFSDKESVWLVYDLKTGARLESRDVAAPTKEVGDGRGFARQIAVAPLGNEGLALVHWYVYAFRGGHAVFQIIDRAGAVVWSRPIEDEYASMGDRWSWWNLSALGIRQIDAAPDGAGFTIGSFAQKQRTAYTVTHDAEKRIVVTAGASTPGQPEARPVAPLELKVTRREPKPAGEVTLGGAATLSPIEGAHHLTFDGRGNIGWVRWPREGEKSLFFVLIDRQGKVVREQALALPEEKNSRLPRAAWIEGDRWLVTRSVYTDHSTELGSAWFLDASTGVLKPLEKFANGSIERVAPTGDGGFLVLGSANGDIGLRHQLTRYDREGAVVETKAGDGPGVAGIADDIAVLSDGTVAKVAIVAQQLTLTRPDGGEKIVSLGGYQYAANVRADKDGGFVVYDSADKNALHRFDKDGKLWQSFHVSGPKGEPFRIYDAFAVDPDGRVWASDGTRIYRAGPDGKADVALGGPPEGSMAEPVAVTVDDKGLVYAVEKGTAAVHVFDAAGKRVRVMKPDPTDTPTQDALAWITVAADGTVRYRMTYEGPVVSFDGEGKRIGIERPAEGWRLTDAERWRPVGGGWEAGSDALRRNTAEGEVKVDHRPSGAFIVGVKEAVGTADGTVAVLCVRMIPGGWAMRSEGPLYLCVYGPDGKGLGEVALPETSRFHGLRFDGAAVCVSDERGVTRFTLPLKPEVDRFDYEDADGSFWHTISCSETRAVVWKAGSRSVLTLDLPK